MADIDLSELPGNLCEAFLPYIPTLRQRQKAYAFSKNGYVHAVQILRGTSGNIDISGLPQSKKIGISPQSKYDDQRKHFYSYRRILYLQGWLSSTVAGGKAQAVAPKPTKSKTDTKKGQTKSSSPDDLTHIAEYLTVLKDAINGDSSESGRHKSAAGYSRAAPSPLGLADLVGQIDLLIKEIETSKENLLQIHDVLVNSKGVKDNKQKPVSLKMGLYQLSSELLQNSISKPQKTPTNMPQGAKQKTIETTDKPPEVGFSHIEKWILWLNDVTQWSEQQILKQEIRDQPEQPESCSGKMWKTSKLIEMEKAIRNSSTHIQKLSLELPAIKENLHATEEIRQRDIEKFQNRLDEMTKTKKDEEAKRRSATRRDVEGLQYQIEQLRTENHRLTADLQEALEQKEYWMKRLSSIAGAKLVDGNPAITDLSDPNRPQKLAERFGELYDNEWTNALEMLPHTNLKEEKDSVVQLVTMLRKAHDHCTSYRENQMQSMTYALFFPIEEDSKINREAGMEDISISVEVRSTMRDLLKKSANQAKKMAFKKFYERLKKTDKKLSRIAEDIITYVDECLDICWMMSLHNPPPCFIWSPQDKKVDPDKFTFFTQSGDVIDYVVWPAMLLHDGGPLLRKGVIQPVKSKK